MFPERMSFTEKEKNAIILWKRTIPQQEFDEECVVTSSLQFSVYATGLGDETQVICGDYSADFGYDDEGEFYFYCNNKDHKG